jgi:hypothetical protein
MLSVKKGLIAASVGMAVNIVLAIVKIVTGAWANSAHQWQCFTRGCPQRCYLPFPLFSTQASRPLASRADQWAKRWTG